MSLENLVRNLDLDLYGEAARKGVSAPRLLCDLALAAGVYPEAAEQRSLEAAALARFRVSPLCPEQERQAREHAAAEWTLRTMLAEGGLDVQRAQVKDFWSSQSSNVLFPAWVDSQIATGLLAQSLAPLIITAEVAVNAVNAGHAGLTETAVDRSSAKRGEGAIAPAARLKVDSRTIKLAPYSARLDASFEALRLQRLPVVSAFLQKLGAQIGVDETDDLLTVAISGDGNAGAGVSDTDAETPGTLDYDEIVRLYLAFTEGHELRVGVFGDALGRTLLQLSPFQDAANFQPGRCDGPLSALWRRWSSTGSSAFSTDRVLGFDNRQAMVQYTEGGAVRTEAKRLIDQQFECIVATKRTAFGKLSYGATQCLDVS